MRDLGKRKDLTLPQQLLFLRACATCKGEGTISFGTLRWKFQVQPTLLSRTYYVRLDYRLGGNPEVFVEAPDIELLASGRELPHVYQNPLRLCLYMPGTEQWAPHKRLAQTIVPWTYTWLFYFEDWLAFDEWRGGGKHPGNETEQQRNRGLRRALARRAR